MEFAIPAYSHPLSRQNMARVCNNKNPVYPKIYLLKGDYRGQDSVSSKGMGPK